MAASDAIVVGEDWISEHYFSTDGKQSFQAKVLERRKAWDDAAKDGQTTTRARFTSARSDLLSTLAGLGEEGGRSADLPDLYARLRAALGYTTVALQSNRVGPVEWIHATGLEATAPLVIVEAVAVKDIESLLAKGDPVKPTRRDRTLLEPYEVDSTTQIFSVARLLSHLFVQDDGPDFALVLAGGWLLVAEKTRWAEGRYLAVDLQLVAERADDKRGGETDRALTCVEAASLAPDPEGNLWWPGVLDESVKHTVGVSKDLREGVRLSIEIIANEVVRRRAAQGLESLPQAEAQELARHSLRYLYRILFLLFAEASPELGVLPVGDPAYEQGYSLDRLRELTLVEIAGPRAEDGTHLYQSLSTLFRLVDEGHQPSVEPVETKPVETTALVEPVETPDGAIEGLTFQPLKADLFLPKATAHIDSVGLGNAALQRVLRHLLLSKESRGKDRGFISYAELGINQLGAVYEGLMSYTGFFAEEDLHEVAKDGNSEKGSWVVPVARSQSIAPKDFVTAPDPVTGESKPVIHEQGTFVFRLAGRERQQSASYYTPEVLTRFTVSQALVELIGPDKVKEGSVEWEGREVPRKMSAREILDLTVCEPALGSGAFAIEAVRQLAAAYLRRRQEETGERIDPDEYAAELQKVKAYIALHNVYGVDLNGTAVELAEISLWLDTMGKGLQAPWFGLHLKRGNSLIGARRAVYRRDQLAKKAWLTAVPTDVPLNPPVEPVETNPRVEPVETNPRVEPVETKTRRSTLGDVGGRIHHFLLPAAGWGSAVEAKEAKELAPEALARLKAWRKTVLVTPSKKQTDELLNLAHRVEALWDLAHQRLRIAEDQVRRSIDVWGADDLPVGGAVTREQIENALADAKGAFQRLRLVMDAWCALWFWPLTDELTSPVEPVETTLPVTPAETTPNERRIEPPSLDEWIAGLRAVLGVHSDTGASGRGRKWTGGDQTLASTADWDELNQAEELELSFAGAQAPDRVLRDHPWLEVCQRVAAQQGFFHWELDFASVFAARGGFDLQVGNPPWVRPSNELASLLAEHDPRWQLGGTGYQDPQGAIRKPMNVPYKTSQFVLQEIGSMSAVQSAIGDGPLEPILGARPDTYQCFMTGTWRRSARNGVQGLIHLETHNNDTTTGRLRRHSRQRLRRHWEFLNELRLFEIQHQKHYGVNIYSSVSDSPSYWMASSLFHPDTAERSLAHDGSGAIPGIKDSETGKWDLRPHSARLIRVDRHELEMWAAAAGDVRKEDVLETPILYAVNRQLLNAAIKIGASERLGSIHVEFIGGVNEKALVNSGLLKEQWGRPTRYSDALLQGSHIYTLEPIFKYWNQSMKSSTDWHPVDLEQARADEIPIVRYQRIADVSTYRAVQGRWSDRSVASDRYRIVWRKMADNSAKRTFLPAIIPPGPAISGSLGALTFIDDSRAIPLLASFLGSLVCDYAIKIAGKNNINPEAIRRLPVATRTDLHSELALRSLRLQAMTASWSDLWTECFDPKFQRDEWTGLPERSGWADLGDVSPEWTPETPLRRAEDRRQALLEIDALVALSLGLTADELCTIYRTQFPVLYGYDRNRDHYDENGRLVPNSVLTTWRKKGGNDGRFSDNELTAVHPGSGVAYTYELPFQTLDREAHMRQAYAEFERRLGKRS